MSKLSFPKTSGVSVYKTKMVVLIISSLLVFHVGAFVIAKNDTGPNLFQDVDGDGLSDSEEKIYDTDAHKADTDGDGYLDGAEVRSGYNPLKKAPGDKLISNLPDIKTGKGGDEIGGKGTNLTQIVSAQLAGLAQAASSENGQTPTLDDINAVLNKTLDQSTSSIQLSEIDPKNIKIKKQNYSGADKDAKIKQDTLDYASQALYIMASNSPVTIKSADDVDTVVNTIASQAQQALTSQNTVFFDTLEQKGQAILDQLKQIEVPENMVPTHTKALQLALYAISLKQELKPISSDPLSYILTLSKAQALLSALQQFSTDFDTTVAQYGITTGIPLLGAASGS